VNSICFVGVPRLPPRSPPPPKSNSVYSYLALVWDHVVSVSLTAEELNAHTTVKKQTLDYTETYARRLGTAPEVLHRTSRKILAWSRVFIITSPIIRQYVIRDKGLEVEDVRGRPHAHGCYIRQPTNQFHGTQQNPPLQHEQHWTRYIHTTPVPNNYRHVICKSPKSSESGHFPYQFLRLHDKSICHFHRGHRHSLS
jgi:hypothetical protein